MSYGPIELLVVEFPGSQFTGEITPALEELVKSGTIRIIDMVVVHKSDEGEVTWLELADEPDEIAGALEPIVDLDDDGLLDDEDVHELARSLSPGSTAAIMLFENQWAIRFATAVRNANGRVVLNERIPGSVIEELIATGLYFRAQYFDSERSRQ
jgi:uncharacterized membrane protein